MPVPLCSVDYFLDTNGSCTCTMGAKVPWFTKLLNTEFDKGYTVKISQPKPEKMKCNRGSKILKKKKEGRRVGEI